jgi:hypothetical protein
MFRTTNRFLTVSPDGKIITQTLSGAASADRYKFYNAFIDNLVPDASGTIKISFRCLNPGEFRNTVFAWVSPDRFDLSKETELYDTFEYAQKKLFINCSNGGLSTFNDVPVVRYGKQFNVNDVITFEYQPGRVGENSGRLFCRRNGVVQSLLESRLGVKLPFNLIPVIGINDLGASWQIIDPPALRALAGSSASSASASASSASASASAPAAGLSRSLRVKCPMCDVTFDHTLSLAAESDRCIALQGELARMRLHFQDMERQHAHSQQQFQETQRQLAHSQQQLQETQRQLAHSQQQLQETQQQLQSRHNHNLERLSCTVCDERFDMGAHRPMFLVPCGHTYCHTCIARLQQCPLCYVIKTGQAENWFVKDLPSQLQGKKRKRSKKIPKW